MTNINLISPYIRLATPSTIHAPFHVKRRIIFDYEVIYIQKGGCVLKVEDKVYHCHEGQAIFIRPGISHSFKSPDKVTPFVQPHCHFDVQYNKNSEKTPISFRDYKDLNDSEKKLIQEDLLSKYPIPVVFTPSDPELFSQLLHRVINDFQNHTAKGFAARADMFMLLSLLLQWFPAEEEEQSPVLYNKIEAIHDYLMANYTQNISLESLSAFFYMNQYTLTRQFRKQYGQPVMHFYRTLRIQYAYRRLREDNASVSDITDELHYSDIYAFSHFFKRATGVSPSEYKKMTK